MSADRMPTAFGASPTRRRRSGQWTDVRQRWSMAWLLYPVRVHFDVRWPALQGMVFCHSQQGSRITLQLTQLRGPVASSRITSILSVSRCRPVNGILSKVPVNTIGWPFSLRNGEAIAMFRLCRVLSPVDGGTLRHGGDRIRLD